MQIDHVVLWVEDAARALTFYSEVLGLAPVRGEEFASGQAPFPSVRISDGSILDLMPAIGAPLVKGFTGEAKATAAGQPLNHVCLAMEPAEYDALAARLEKAGVAMHRMGERSFGAPLRVVGARAPRWFYFQDLDGNVLEARCYEDGRT